MNALDLKQRILDDGEFEYNIRREAYVNRKTKKLFSIEFIDDHDPETLERFVRERTDGQEWRFYFNVEPSETMRRELERLLG